MSSKQHRESINNAGYTIIGNVYSNNEIEAILGAIERADRLSPNFRRTEGLFAIRQFLKEVPDMLPLILTEHFMDLVKELVGNDYFIVKSIYFDKPDASNWFVSYHQDLTISVNKKLDLEGYGPWTVKQNQYAAQPPIELLKSNCTIRIHLDDTDANNGALRVIGGSHKKGITRPETIDKSENETTCSVPRGGIMIMKPLLLHASGRTTNGKQRRVIHIELSNQRLPGGLEWSEKQYI